MFTLRIANARTGLWTAVPDFVEIKRKSQGVSRKFNCVLRDFPVAFSWVLVAMHAIPSTRDCVHGN